MNICERHIANEIFLRRLHDSLRRREKIQEQEIVELYLLEARDHHFLPGLLATIMDWESLGDFTTKFSV